ncbi:MAG: non-heme iron protein, hemerythrin family [Helicobacteraceae bacterium CG2_30_36_10]|nr:MAG: non-heme iron protein, hemerythrin family [Helicobacteraceae bacterium CG2_30_36_10]
MSNNEKVHWKESYSVGIRLVDHQHKKLFDLVNRLYDLEDNVNIKEQIREILYAFREYTIVHFKDEEDYMKDIGYPELNNQKQLHKDIIESLSQIMQTPASLSIIKTKMRIVAKRVLIEHIVIEDQKIGVYVREHNIKEKIYNIN